MRRKELRRWLSCVLFVAPAIATISFLFTYAICYGAWLSVNEKKLGGPASFVGLQNYVEVLTSPIFNTSLINTFIYASVAVAVKTLIGLAGALLLNKTFRGRGVMRGLMMVPWSMPVFVIVMVFYMMFDSRSNLNKALLSIGIEQIRWLGPDLAMSSLILVNVWKGWPFFFLGLLSGLQSIKVELYESAELDGASSLQKFWYVTLPNLKPVLLIVTLLSAMWTFGDFATVYLLTAGGPMDRTLTIPVASYKIAFYGLKALQGIPQATAYIMISLPFYLALMYVITRKVK